MSIGEYSKPLRVQEAVETPDGGGGFTMGWQDIADAQIFAKIETEPQAETTLARGLRRPITCRITLPYRGDINPMQRLVDDSYAYHIMSLREEDALLAITALRSPL